VYLAEMGDADEKRGGAKPLISLQAALAYIEERLRKNPKWDSRFDETYCWPDPFFLKRMTEAEFAAWQTRREKQRQCLSVARPAEFPPGFHRADPPPRPQPQPVVRACLPFGQRIRDLRRALRWTQREAAWQLGVSRRSIIRYEQGRSAPLQAATLLALRRLESAFANQLTANNANSGRERT
jgi:DNA-binding XRE family transcriptional regulator